MHNFKQLWFVLSSFQNYSPYTCSYDVRVWTWLKLYSKSKDLRKVYWAQVFYLMFVWIFFAAVYRRFRWISKIDSYLIIFRFVHWYICLSAWKISAPTGWIFMKFYIWLFFANQPEIIQVWLICDENNGYFNWRPVYIFVISSSVLFRIWNFSYKCCGENQNTYFMFNISSKNLSAHKIKLKNMLEEARPQMTIKYGLEKIKFSCQISKQFYSTHL